MASCIDCKFAELTMFPPCEHEAEGTLAYECRRYPPVPLVLEPAGEGTGDVVQTWPTVQADDWCGEFESTRPETRLLA